MDNENIFDAGIDIQDKVDEINNVIEAEKMAQTEEFGSANEEAAPITESEAISKKFEKKDENYVLTLERLHIRLVGDAIDIFYRPSHDYITSVKNDENGRAEVKRLIAMTRDEFKEYLNGIFCFKTPSKIRVDNKLLSSDEKWYQSAWKTQTEKLLGELEVLNPIEEPITA